jgi:choice-of-anchor B domain-containing protein
MPKNLTLLAVVLVGTFFTGSAFSHGERIKPVFVSPNGVDVGQCDDATAPCQSIGYALRWVGKGGQIRMASGQYRVTNADDMFHLVGDVFDIRGGFDARDEFRTSVAQGSTLIGIPEEFAPQLRNKGFHVLSDGKAVDQEIVAEAANLLQRHASLKVSVSSQPCVDGSAGSFDCDKVDLLSHVALDRGVSGADVWGYVDLNTNREYAFVGYSTGTGVFDVTDASNPREVGFIDGQRTSWRDIKVYQHWNAPRQRFDAYAYITTDGSGDGLFVVDLTGLPHSVARVNYFSDFSAAHNVLATNADFGTGLSMNGDVPSLIIAGANTGVGQYRHYSLNNPRDPVFTTMPSAGITGYMHDAASMLITDDRKNSQCVNAASSPYCEILFDFNVDTVDIWDITDPNNPELLSSPTYPQAEYIHSGWWTEDKQYLIVHDELDEIRRFNTDVPTTMVRVFSLADLTAPVLAGAWDGGTAEVDHNGFTRGNRYYMSNYSRGISILDISDPNSPTLAGFLDTYPGQALNTIGAWGAYPYFHSGNVAVSDINSGFYMVADRTLDVPQGRLGFAQLAYGGEEGSALQVAVSRNGSATGVVSVDYEVLAATADAADIAGGSGTLSWASGDAADKIITLNLLNDGNGAEQLERMLVKLVSPSGGATLDSTNVASVYISEPGAVSTVQFSQEINRIAERGFATGIAVIQRSGSAIGVASVDYALTSGDATAGADFQGATSGTVSWSAGDADPKWIEFPITDDGSNEDLEFIELTLSNATGAVVGTQATWRLEIADGAGVNTAPNAIAGASQTVSGGSNVSLDGTASNDPDGDNLTYQWTQVAGTTVTLNNANSARASFTAPTVSSDTLLRFNLTVSDSGGLSNAATTQVTVRRTAGGGGGSGGGSLSWMLLAVLTALLLKRMLFDNRLLAIRTRRNDIDRHTRQLLDSSQVISRVRR